MYAIFDTVEIIKETKIINVVNDFIGYKCITARHNWDEQESLERFVKNEVKKIKRYKENVTEQEILECIEQDKYFKYQADGMKKRVSSNAVNIDKYEVFLLKDAQIIFIGATKTATIELKDEQNARKLYKDLLSKLGGERNYIYSIDDQKRYLGVEVV